MADVGRPLKFTPQEFSEKIDAYFKMCKEANRPLTITGLALALNTTRETLREYKQRPEYVDSLKRALAICENYAEERLFGIGQVTGAIFNLKNNYDWKDKQEINHGGQGNDNPIITLNLGAIGDDKDVPLPASEFIP